MPTRELPIREAPCWLRHGAYDEIRRRIGVLAVILREDQALKEVRAAVPRSIPRTSYSSTWLAKQDMGARYLSCQEIIGSTRLIHSSGTDSSFSGSAGTLSVIFTPLAFIHGITLNFWKLHSCRLVPFISLGPWRYAYTADT